MSEVFVISVTQLWNDEHWPVWSSAKVNGYDNNVWDPSQTTICQLLCNTVIALLMSILVESEKIKIKKSLMTRSEHVRCAREGVRNSYFSVYNLSINLFVLVKRQKCLFTSRNAHPFLSPAICPSSQASSLNCMSKTLSSKECSLSLRRRLQKHKILPTNLGLEKKRILKEINKIAEHPLLWERFSFCD